MSDLDDLADRAARARGDAPYTLPSDTWRDAIANNSTRTLDAEQQRLAAAWRRWRDGVRRG